MRIQYLIFILHLILLTHSLASTHTKGHLPGAPSEPTTVTDESTLNIEYKKINDFVRKNVPEVKDLKLTAYKHQIVAGKQYILTYSPATPSTTVKDIDITVWSKPWENNFLLTKRPDGTVVKEGGRAASSNTQAKPAETTTIPPPVPASTAGAAPANGIAAATTKTS